MSDYSAQMLHVLAEMRDLLRLIAEPAIAQRDKKLRESLRDIAGSAAAEAKAVTLSRRESLPVIARRGR